MTSRFRAVPALAILALALPMAAHAQDPDGFRSALLNDLDALEQKYTQLADAVPAENYGWRPMEGVRSVSEVYAHVVAANYMFAGLMGHDAPEDIGIESPPQNLEQVTDKAKVMALLEHSFPFVRSVIEGTSDADLDREITLFGQPSTVREALLLTTTHMHEHLGQSIAYARSLKVTPPWSQ